MGFLIAALAMGAVVGSVYIASAVRAFSRVRRELLAMPADRALATHNLPLVDERQAARFGWKASGGVVASTSVLIAISATGWTWYFLPFLAICSSVAVIVAFVIDR